MPPVASNTLTSVRAGTCGGNQCLVDLTGKLNKVPGYSWSLHGVVNYLRPEGIWSYCGQVTLDTLQIGPDVYYHGQTSPLFLKGHTYQFETVVNLLDAQGNVAVIAHSQYVSCTIPGS